MFAPQTTTPVRAPFRRAARGPSTAAAAAAADGSTGDFCSREKSCSARTRQERKRRTDRLIRHRDNLVDELPANIVGPLRRHGRSKTVRDGVDALHMLWRRGAKAAAHDIRSNRLDAVDATARP